jgi:glycosyltransferase involved in cell wall biosynthesis
VIFPAFNEVENVRYMVESVMCVLQRLGIPGEVIVVDDGSSDGTAAAAMEMAGADPRVRVVGHEVNMGIGRAVWSGIRAATMPWVFYTDCDGQFDLGELQLLWELRSGADVISGFRRNRQDPLMRLLYSFAYNSLAYLLFWGGFRDVDASFKLFRREIFSRFDVRSNSSVADLELLLLPRKLGMRVLQVPVSHYPRRAGTVSCESFRNGIFAWVRIGPIFEMFVQLLKLRARVWRGDVRKKD